uniref:Uncharacterized protein n=1 Tax=Plectus sambesii TaxID=2011161 RepID=A0A914VKG4_9BILA
MRQIYISDNFMVVLPIICLAIIIVIFAVMFICFCMFWSWFCGSTWPRKGSISEATNSFVSIESGSAFDDAYDSEQKSFLSPRTSNDCRPVLPVIKEGSSIVASEQYDDDNDCMLSEVHNI